MTGKQFAAALVQLDFPGEHHNSRGITEFAAALELNVATVRRWASGQWPVPVHISALVKLMLKTRTRAKDLIT